MSHENSATAIAAQMMSARTSDRSPLFDLAPNGVLAVDVDGTIVYANAPALRMFGYTSDQLLGRSLEVLVPARFAEIHEDHRRRYNRNPRNRAMGTSGLTLVGLRHDGTEFPVDVAFGTVTQDGVDVTFAAVTDLSHRQSVESRLNDVSRAYATLEAMTRHMSGAQDMAGVLEVACNLAVVEGRYIGAWAGRATDDGRILVVASADSVKGYVSGLDLKLDLEAPGPVAIALTTGTPTFIEDFDEHAADTPWIAVARRYGIRASATLPVRCESEVVAALTFFSATPDVFNAEVRSVLEGIAATVRTYLEHARSDTRLRALERHRRDLLQRLVDAQERERAKIAADVHDDTIGTLVAVQLRLSLLETKIATAAPELRPEVETLHEALDDATDRLRNLLFDLDAPDESVSISEAIRAAAAYIFEGTPIQWEVTGQVTGPVSDPSFVQALRIAKEALANARAHSGAHRVTVTVRDRDGGLEISIRDDGTGFDRSSIGTRPGHRGLATMRDRAEVAGGSFDIESDRRAGTTLRAWLPAAAPPPPED